MFWTEHAEADGESVDILGERLMMQVREELEVGRLAGGSLGVKPLAS